MAELQVLIVDEDPDSRVNTRKALGRARLAVVGETGFGTAGVSLAVATKPDIILVAIEEPVGRPLQTAEGITNALPDTPMIFYSSINSTEAVRRSMTFGARDYLVKPLQGQSLREAVVRALEHEERRQLRRAGKLEHATGRGSVITVCGAKGGIGKTVISVNLGLALRQETGKSVLVIDADAHFGDVATMLDVAPTFTVAELLRHSEGLSRDSFSQYLTVHPSGLQILAAPQNGEGWEQADRDTVRRLLDIASQLFEFVVVDTDGSMDAMVRACIEYSTLALLVTSGEVSSIRDTAQAMARIQKAGISADRTRVVLNRGRGGRDISLADVKQALNTDVFWEIPFDKAVPESVQFGRPVIGTNARTPSAASIRQLARRAAGTTISLVPQADGRKRSWLRFGRLKGKEQNDHTEQHPVAPIIEVPEIRQ
jgi:pilus assembly protein CpaE